MSALKITRAAGKPSVGGLKVTWAARELFAGGATGAMLKCIITLPLSCKLGGVDGDRIWCETCGDWHVADSRELVDTIVRPDGSRDWAC